jgi:hypothetical protein
MPTSSPRCSTSCAPTARSDAPTVRALEEPLSLARMPLLAGTPWTPLLMLAGAWLLAAGLLPAPAARLVGLAAAHGALLGTALAWTAVEPAGERWTPVRAGLLLAAAALCARSTPWGAVAYLVVPLWVASRRPAGLRGALGAGAAGAAFGLVLGLHLLVNASLTFGYRVRPSALDEFVAWWAYDVGANVLAAETFFRAGVFARAHRRWSFAAAAALSTAASLTRYLADPLLPHSLEIVAGAMFYLALLGSGNCWLLARTGSVAAPLAASTLFFAAYRLMAPR